MGIRIHKDIGVFVSKEIAPLLFVDNYRDILEELYDDEDRVAAFWQQLPEIAKERLCEDDYYMAKYNLQAMQKQAAEKKYNDKLRVEQVIKTIFFYEDSEDDFQGLLFCSISQAQASRYDDLIDYYESNQMAENSVKYLNKAIYPTSGYVYQGGLDDFLHEDELEIGQVQMEHLGRYATLINQHFYENKLNHEHDFSRLMTEKGFFTPNIDECMFVLALASGILKQEVSFKRFNSLVKPAIITYWS